ncbi:hypothetical protein GOP47_0007658 [Adiantum capillus-veneris]|uniref:Uncharacterized protein n=1 Tax=Adiantum capillus-veneris TaxID=13818 RepID=A0A9D4V193_ADICA|nr:hypothetical protein GOP47_0007658 [Adiantum capillus-veneris]
MWESCPTPVDLLILEQQVKHSLVSQQNKHINEDGFNQTGLKKKEHVRTVQQPKSVLTIDSPLRTTAWKSEGCC